MKLVEGKIYYVKIQSHSAFKRLLKFTREDKGYVWGYWGTIYWRLHGQEHTIQEEYTIQKAYQELKDEETNPIRDGDNHNDSYYRRDYIKLIRPLTKKEQMKIMIEAL